MQKTPKNIFGQQFVIKPIPRRADLPVEKQVTENHFKSRLPQLKEKLTTETEGQDYEADN